MPDLKRRRGRPAYSRIIIKRWRLAELPNRIYPAVLAQFLNVNKSLVYYWAHRNDLPLQVVDGAKSYVLKTDVVEFLERTGRLAPQRGVLETEETDERSEGE